ncbi:DUF1273 domain-containing protein [Paenibacillus pinistramenti]|uniref:DUF1273 domain-containing protein n=1 Tax=Paenibacillus pinistramenti TaxID=1768003 RepID=UPI0011085C2D|nr:DUF1273 domain-containing protein [Paenibacillus pinistramenti]
MKNLLVTGYRAHELNIFNQKHEGIAYIKQAVTNKLIPLIEEGLEWVITPGQYGVDLWACEAAIDLRRRYPQLKCSILAAYANPEENWKEDKQDYFRQMTEQVDYYGAVSKQPYSGVWQLTARDDMLLRKSDGLLLVYDEDAGEASPKFIKQKALKKQEKEDYPVLIITAEDIESLVNERQAEGFEAGAPADDPYEW